MARTITVLSLLTLALAGCPRHTGGPNTPHGNEVMLSRSGMPSKGHWAKATRCPSPNGEGSITLSHQNGKKRVKGECRGGIMVGAWKAWYRNGAVVWKADFDDRGMIVGKFKSYHANDEDWAVVPFKEGLPDGKVKTWHRNGKKASAGKYFGGKPGGCHETWHDNGQKASKGTYAEGRKVKSWLYWTASGAKRKEKLGGEPTHGACLITF